MPSRLGKIHPSHFLLKLAAKRTLWNLGCLILLELLHWTRPTFFMSHTLGSSWKKTISVEIVWPSHGRQEFGQLSSIFLLTCSSSSCITNLTSMKSQWCSDDIVNSWCLVENYFQHWKSQLLLANIWKEWIYRKKKMLLLIALSIF